MPPMAEPTKAQDAAANPGRTKNELKHARNLWIAEMLEISGPPFDPTQQNGPRKTRRVDRGLIRGVSTRIAALTPLPRCWPVLDWELILGERYIHEADWLWPCIDDILGFFVTGRMSRFADILPEYLWYVGEVLECPQFQNAAMEACFRSDGEVFQRLYIQGAIDIIKVLEIAEPLDRSYGHHKLFTYITDRLLWDSAHGGTNWLLWISKGSPVAKFLAKAHVEAAKSPTQPDQPPSHPSNRPKYMINIVNPRQHRPSGAQITIPGLGKQYVEWPRQLYVGSAQQFRIGENLEQERASPVLPLPTRIEPPTERVFLDENLSWQIRKRNPRQDIPQQARGMKREGSPLESPRRRPQPAFLEDIYEDDSSRGRIHPSRMGLVPVLQPSEGQCAISITHNTANAEINCPITHLVASSAVMIEPSTLANLRPNPVRPVNPRHIMRDTNPENEQSAPQKPVADAKTSKQLPIPGESSEDDFCPERDPQVSSPHFVQDRNPESEPQVPYSAPSRRILAEIPNCENQRLLPYPRYEPLTPSRLKQARADGLKAIIPPDWTAEYEYQFFSNSV